MRRIGDGGMSVVYMAVQESLKRHVALKVMRVRDEVPEDHAERFIHEAETIAQLDHPNIVGIFDVGQAPDGSLYYSMPFLDHGDLRSFHYEGDERRLIELLGQLCAGLGYAHEHDVVHRDMKPENVMFDKFGNAQIADFGIALTGTNRRWTKEGQVIGSVDYMSPEQCQARGVDSRSDVYSLGIITWELLTGDVPFDAEDEMGIMLAQVSDPLPDLPWELRHWLPVLKRCLAKSPEDRFQDVTELRQALAELPSSPPARWVAQGWVSLVSLWERWQRRVWISAAAAGFLAATGLAIHFWRQSTAPPPAPPVVIEETIPAQVDPVALEQPEPSPDIPEPEPEPAIPGDRALLLVDEALGLIAQDRLSRPEDDNAADRLVSVLEVYPGHAQALDALAALSNRYRQLIEAALDDADFERARAHVVALTAIWQRADVPESRFPLVVSSVVDAVVGRVDHEIDRLDAWAARQALAVGLAMLPEAAALDERRQRLEAMPEMGEVLVDSQGLDTVFVPPRLERPDGRLRNTAQGFAIMATEITVADYRRFVDQRGWSDSGCRSRGEAPALIRPRNWREPGMDQEASHPVVCVSWQDATAFAEWLSARSGNLYRLPDAEEWRHAAWIGHESDTACETGNVAGEEAADFVETPLSCRDEVRFTAPVAGFQPSRLGLYDLRGNVREWVWDCAPSDTGFNQFLDKLNLKESDPCTRRTVRGTSWLDGRGTSMLQFEQHEDADAARSYVGFRLVRDLVAERERERARQEGG